MRTFSAGIKRLPFHSREFQHYHPRNPLWITAERQSLDTICRRFNGYCLFCPQPPHHYDLAMCFDREVWVFYSQQAAWPATIHLAQAVQQNGAAEIVVIRLGI